MLPEVASDGAADYPIDAGVADLIHARHSVRWRVSVLLGWLRYGWCGLRHQHRLRASASAGPWGVLRCARCGRQAQFRLTLGGTCAASWMDWRITRGCPATDQLWQIVTSSAGARVGNCPPGRRG